MKFGHFFAERCTSEGVRVAGTGTGMGQAGMDDFLNKYVVDAQKTERLADGKYRVVAKNLSTSHCEEEVLDACTTLHILARALYKIRPAPAFGDEVWSGTIARGRHDLDCREEICAAVMDALDFMWYAKKGKFCQCEGVPAAEPMWALPDIGEGEFHVCGHDKADATYVSWPDYVAYARGALAEFCESVPDVDICAECGAPDWNHAFCAVHGACEDCCMKHCNECENSRAVWYSGPLLPA